MKIEVKDKYTGKNIKEPNSEIPDPPKSKEESKEKEAPAKKTQKRHRRAPIGLIILIAAIIGIVAGIIFAINIFTKKSELIGIWVRENDVWTYEFKEDGSGSYGLGFGTPMPFQYKDKGEYIEITDKKGIQTNYDYHFEDDKLVIKDQFGRYQTYRKKGTEDKSESSSPEKEESLPKEDSEDTTEDKLKKLFPNLSEEE